MNDAKKATNTQEEIDADALEGQVVQHKVRPEWGPAVLVWRRESKSGFQFEDGQIRAFQDSWLHMLVPIAGTLDGNSQLAHLLRRRAEIAQEEARAGGKRATKPALPFDEQVRRFLVDFPGGFVGENWLKDIHGEGESRRLKRFRDPALGQAGELLDAKSLGELVANADYEEVWARAMKVMKGTDLVTPSQLQAIKDMPDEGKEPYANVLLGLLHGEGPIEQRFDAHVLTVGKNNCSWQLATALLALVHPQDQVCVRPSNFRTQARLLAPHLQVASVPNGRNYTGWLAMAKKAQAKLGEFDQKPRDLVDVYDFIRLTARTS